jgi:hypothetical protein
LASDKEKALTEQLEAAKRKLSELSKELSISQTEEILDSFCRKMGRLREDVSVVPIKWGSARRCAADFGATSRAIFTAGRRRQVGL